MGKRSRLRKIKAVGDESAFSQQSNPKKNVSLKQRIPKKLAEMMEMKEIYKEGSSRKIRRKLNERMGMGLTDTEKKRRHNAKRKPGESHYRHIRRLEDAVVVSKQVAESKIQEFPEKNTKTKKNEDVGEKKSKNKERLQKMKEKRKKIRQTKDEELKEKERWTDHVEFGEVVMRPPTLTSKPRKAGDLKKPGQRDLLFLKTGFGNRGKSNMSMARTKALNDERDRVIQAYRDMKKRKQEE